MPRDKSHADDAFKARKLAIQKRLMADGRWEEASRFKEQVRKHCRDAGMSADASVQASWDEVERNYPPLDLLGDQRAAAEERDVGRLAGPEPPAAVPAEPVEPVPSGPNRPAAPAKPDEKPAASSPPPPDRPERIYIPSDWGELPGTAKRTDEVEWVHQNWFLCREERPSGVRMVLRKAQSPAPSHGAIGLLKVAIMNPQKFEAEVYGREMKAAGEEDEDQIRRERKSIAEIERILDQMEAKAG